MIIGDVFIRVGGSPGSLWTDKTGASDSQVI
jgi:hypothetical protein